MLAPGAPPGRLHSATLKASGFGVRDLGWGFDRLEWPWSLAMSVPPRLGGTPFPPDPLPPSAGAAVCDSSTAPPGELRARSFPPALSFKARARRVPRSRSDRKGTPPSAETPPPPFGKGVRRGQLLEPGSKPPCGSLWLHPWGLTAGPQSPGERCLPFISSVGVARKEPRSGSLTGALENWRAG